MGAAVFEQPSAFELTKHHVQPEHLSRDFDEGQSPVFPEHGSQVAEGHVQISGCVDRVARYDAVERAVMLRLGFLLDVQDFER